MTGGSAWTRWGGGDTLCPATAVTKAITFIALAGYVFDAGKGAIQQDVSREILKTSPTGTSA